jgi:hypothetical protein
MLQPLVLQLQLSHFTLLVFITVGCDSLQLRKEELALCPAGV